MLVLGCNISSTQWLPSGLKLGTSSAWNKRTLQRYQGLISTWFPLGLKNLEKRQSIFQSGKSRGILLRLKKSGKSQGILPKILEKIRKCYTGKFKRKKKKQNCWKSWGHLSVSNSENPANMVWYFKLKKRTGKLRKHWKSRGNLSVWKYGNHESKGGRS